MSCSMLKIFKSKIIVLLGILLFSGFFSFPLNTHASSAYVQSRSEYTTDGTLAYSGNVTSGHLLILVVSGHSDVSGTVLSTISDTQGLTWQTAAEKYDNTTLTQALFIGVYYAFAASTGSESVTVTTRPTDAGIVLYEYSGITTSGTVNAVSSLGMNSGGTTTPTAGSITTSAQSLFFFLMGDESAIQGSITQGTNYTLRETQLTHVDAQQERTGVAAGTYSSESITINTSSVNTGAFIVAFKESSTIQAGKFGKITLPPNNLGLVVYHTFDGPRVNTTTSTDSSTSGFNGALSGSSGSQSRPLPVQGKIGQALNFDGTDDVVNLGDVADQTGSFSVAVWIKPFDVSGAGGRIIVKDNNEGWALSYNDSGPNNIRFFCRQTGPVITDADGFLSSNTWSHVVGVFDTDANTKTIYIDGIQRAQDTGVTGDPSNNIHPLGIGDDPGAGVSAPFKGTIDEVRIYSRALSATQAAALYNTGSAKFGKSNATVVASGLIAYHTFDGPKLNTTTSTDSSSIGNNGTLTNSPAPVGGKIGQALKFDGSDDYVNFTSTPTTGTGSFSAFTWIKTSATGITQAIVNWGRDSTDNDGVYLFVDTDNKLHVDVTNVVGTLSAATVTDGAWHHVGMVNTVGTFQLYIDGVASGSTASLSPNIVTGNDAGDNAIGIAFTGSFVNPFKGLIDDVRIYNRALSTAEILQLYQGGAVKLREL
jgi:hypothetical protein